MKKFLIGVCGIIMTGTCLANHLTVTITNNGINGDASGYYFISSDFFDTARPTGYKVGSSASNNYSHGPKNIEYGYTFNCSNPPARYSYCMYSLGEFRTTDIENAHVQVNCKDNICDITNG